MAVQWNVAVVPSMMVWFTGVVTKLGGTAKKHIASFCLCCKINMTLTERPVSCGKKSFQIKPATYIEHLDVRWRSQ